MKYLLFFLILTACGKHTTPPEIDLRDSDGDGNSNAYDADKYKAEVITVEEVNAELEFETGLSIVKKHKFSLSNNIDLQTFSKDLMVKSSLTITESDFFSEFSILKIKSIDSKFPVLDGKTSIKLSFSKVQTAPRSLFLVTKTKRIRLEDWNESMGFELTKSDLEAVLKGEAFFSLSHMDKHISFQNQTQEMRIKEKNYRVVYNDGKTTEIHYISKELSLDKTMEKLNISTYKFIEEENLLTTTIKPTSPEWWVRQNQNDIVIIKDNLRALSDHYLKGFSKTQNQIMRTNGFVGPDLKINSKILSKVLLKIRTNQVSTTFIESKVDNRRRSGGRDNSDMYGCVDSYRRHSTEKETYFSFTNFLETFLINKNDVSRFDVRKMIDEKGEFFEVEFSGAEQYDVSLINLDKLNYEQVGKYKSSDCVGSDRNGVFTNDLQSSERSLKFQIEAFVENI